VSSPCVVASIRGPSTRGREGASRRRNARASPHSGFRRCSGRSVLLPQHDAPAHRPRSVPPDGLQPRWPPSRRGRRLRYIRQQIPAMRRRNWARSTPVCPATSAELSGQCIASSVTTTPRWAPSSASSAYGAGISLGSRDVDMGRQKGSIVVNTLAGRWRGVEMVEAATQRLAIQRGAVGFKCCAGWPGSMLAEAPLPPQGAP
jgi:hypothetical protein